MRRSARKKQLRRRCLLAGVLGAGGVIVLVLTAGRGEMPQNQLPRENPGEEILSESVQEDRSSGDLQYEAG